MAGHMKTPERQPRKMRVNIRPRWTALVRFALYAFCWTPLISGAGTLQDPTRPPPEWYSPDAGASIAAPRGPQLQSVQISEGRRSAMISGRRVRLGDRFGDARVVEMNENEVVLKSGKGLQRLRLFPGVDKRVIIHTQRDKR